MSHLAKALSSFVLSSFLFVSFSAEALDPDKLMGQGLYEQTGSNSCLFCHGIDGKGGNVAAAAKLDQPKTWKSYKALGGDAALKKDPAAFLEKLGAAVVTVIQKGAIRFNSTYKDPNFDWSKIKKFDGQMMGVTGAASAAWIKKYKNRGMSSETASKAVWMYLAELDGQGILK